MTPRERLEGLDRRISDAVTEGWLRHDEAERHQEALRSLLASEARMRAAVTKAKAQLDRARPAFTNLTTHQRQLDMDGCEVGVSRQAVDETVDAILAASDTLLATHLALEEPHE